MSIRLLTLILATAAAPAFAGEQITLTIDPNLSQAEFELCAIGVCDNDSSPIAGFMVIDLDNTTAPTEMNLYDYSFELTEDLVFNIQIFLGTIDVLATDVNLFYPTPGVPFGPAPVVAGEFDLMNVPALASGTAEYHAGGLACVLLGGAGLPCDDVIDLATLGEVTADSIVGTITIEGNQITLNINAAISLPLLPDNPDLAQLDFVGTIVATGTLPETLPGDFDGDGDVDINDFGAFIACHTGPGGGIIVPACAAFDFDDDEDVDFIDFGALQAAFTGSGLVDGDPTGDAADLDGDQSP